MAENGSVICVGTTEGSWDGPNNGGLDISAIDSTRMATRSGGIRLVFTRESWLIACLVIGVHPSSPIAPLAAFPGH